MRRIILLLLAIGISSSSFAETLQTRWNRFFRKELIITCENEELICSQVCNDKYYCVVKEEICRDCTGTTPYLTNIFKEMGRMYVRAEKVGEDELTDFIATQQFTTFSSESIFNHISAFKDPAIVNAFKSLCPQSVSATPLVFFAVDGVSKELGQAKYLSCQINDNVDYYKISDDGNVVVNK